jgi:hypothetical protein
LPGQDLNWATQKFDLGLPEMSSTNLHNLKALESGLRTRHPSCSNKLNLLLNLLFIYGYYTSDISF